VLVAHDLGTTGDKASLHDDTGRLVRSVTVRYPTHFGAGGVVEQDPHDWWQAFTTATRRLLDESGVPAADVAGLAISGQMMGVVLLDGQLEPLGPSIIWADTRSTAECDRLLARLDPHAAYATLGHRLNPTYSLTKLMWVREHQPELFAAARHMCLAKDYVVARLTGVLATDPSDASSTNAFDQRAGVWSAEVLAAAELPVELFPDVVASTTVVGGVTPEAARATGLLVGTPVVMGGGDGPMAAVGAGVVDRADGAYVYLGSSSWVSMSSEQPLLDIPEMRTMTFNHVVPDRYVPTATMQAGGASLEWIADLLAGSEDVGRFDRLVTAAGAVQDGDDLFFLPYLLGERSPHWNPRARGAFLGLSRRHGPGHLTRAVLEGVAFNLATCVDAFRAHGAAVDRVDAIGGGAASDTWLQILADVWGATVRRRTVVEEANSLGAAITAGVGVGLLPDFGAARQLSEVVATFEPDPDRHRAYAVRHARFTDAYERLEGWFDGGGA
jgi:xylulokinase